MNRATQLELAEEPATGPYVRIGRDHYGLAVYEKRDSQLWAVGSGEEIDRAVALYIEEELASRSLKDLLDRYQPMADAMVLIQTRPIDVIDESLERLVRWAVKRDPGLYLGGPHAASKPRIAIVEGLPSSFAIRLD